MQVRWKNTFISTLSRPISELWNTGQPGQMPDWITWTRTETFEGEIRFYGEHRITDEQWVYYFVGGRRSLIRFFADRASRTILAPHGSSIGLIMERKHYVFKKDMTLVALCDIGARSPYPIRALSDFRGVPNLRNRASII